MAPAWKTQCFSGVQVYPNGVGRGARGDDLLDAVVRSAAPSVVDPPRTAHEEGRQAAADALRQHFLDLVNEAAHLRSAPMAKETPKNATARISKRLSR